MKRMKVIGSIHRPWGHSRLYETFSKPFLPAVGRSPKILDLKSSDPVRFILCSSANADSGSLGSFQPAESLPEKAKLGEKFGSVFLLSSYLLTTVLRDKLVELQGATGFFTFSYKKSGF